MNTKNVCVCVFYGCLWKMIWEKFTMWKRKKVKGVKRRRITFQCFITATQLKSVLLYYLLIILRFTCTSQYGKSQVRRFLRALVNFGLVKKTNIILAFYHLSPPPMPINDHVTFEKRKAINKKHESLKTFKLVNNIFFLSLRLTIVGQL